MSSERCVYTIDGSAFATLEEFYDHVGDLLIPGACWGKNLDALNDVLRGGFGPPDEGFILVWRHSDLSRRRLGYRETVRQLERRLRECQSTVRPDVAADLDRARHGHGPTVFDWLVEIIDSHEDIQLRLE